MDTKDILETIRKTESPLRRQMLTAALIDRLLEDDGRETPVVIGGCALSYYSREVFFTADLDLAYGDRETLDRVLRSIGFQRQGRYWVNPDLNMLVEAPAASLAGEDAPIEVVEMAEGLKCRVIGIEDLLVDRLNACKHWNSEIDCEMVRLLISRYRDEVDWTYLEHRAGLPENNVLLELKNMKDHGS